MKSECKFYKRTTYGGRTDGRNYIVAVIRESAESTQRLLAASPALEHSELFALMELSAGNIRGLRSAWEAVKESMSAGVESTRWQTAVEKVLRAIEAESCVANILVEMAERNPSPLNSSANRVEDFRRLIEQVESIRQSASRLLDWLRTRRGLLDENLLEQSLLDLERGNYENGADILARLQAGGDL